jgi:hypothetical protein
MTPKERIRVVGRRFRGGPQLARRMAMGRGFLLSNATALLLLCAAPERSVASGARWIPGPSQKKCRPRGPRALAPVGRRGAARGPAVPPLRPGWQEAAQAAAASVPAATSAPLPAPTPLQPSPPALTVAAFLKLYYTPEVTLIINVVPSV